MVEFTVVMTLIVLHFSIALMGVFDISFLVNIMMFKMFAMVPNTHIWKIKKLSSKDTN